MFSGSVAILFERVEEARISDWIARFVAASGHTGFISFDLILDAEGEVWGIECNPRTTSGIHFFDNPAIARAVLEGLPAAPRAERQLQQFYSVLTELSGVMFRRGYFSVLRKLLGTRDVTWSWRDPMPALSMIWTTWPIIRLSIEKGVPFSEVATLDVGWFEEPLAPAEEEGYRLLHARATIPVATGEALYTAFAFDRLLAPRAMDVAQPDLALVGGLSQGRLISQLCTLRHARLSPHVWGSGLGLAAAVHLVAAHPAYPATTNEADPPWVEYDVADNPLRDEILLAPLRPVQGRIAVPMAPGLGVEPDRAALVRFRPR
jgi:hypothetical protein